MSDLCRPVVLAACVGLLSACEPAVEQTGANTGERTATIAATAETLPVGTGFDFYVLALSWAPSYCEVEGSASEPQCNSNRPYAFVVHGLWPQFDKGWPEYCGAEPSYVPDDLVRSLRDIMPDAGLVGYQWRKHGGCTGLDMEDYFAVLRAARERVAVPDRYRTLASRSAVDPDQVERDFVKSNAGLPAKGIAVTCDQSHVREVRVCLTNSLEFRACPAIDRRGCDLQKVVMPPVGG
jgi:ribonuclease T2